MTSSIDRSKTVLYSSDEEKLCIASKDGQKEITDSEVYLSRMSLDGSTVVYLEKATSSRSSLMRYSVKSGKIETLAEIKDKDNNPIAVSPDGSSVLYVNDGELCVYSKGKVTETGEKGTPVGVSDGGKLVYFMKETKGKYRLNVIVGGETKKIAETSSSYSSLYFNNSYTEVAFDDESGNFYFSKDGAEGEKVKNYDVDLSYEEAYAYNYVSSTGSYVYTLGRSTFIGKAGGTESELCVLTEELKSEKIASKVDRYSIFNGGKSAVYVDTKDNLYYIKDVAKLEAEPEKIAEDIEAVQLWVTPDGSLIYYLNEDYELHAITFKGKDTTCGEDVDSVCQDRFTGNIYYVSDGDLMAVSGAEKAEKLKLKKDAEGVYGSYYVMADDISGNTYILLADGTFEKMG